MEKLSKQFDLTNKIAIITGASKGIGAAMARGLAEYGAKVVISSRKQAAVDAVANELKNEGFEATGIACHVGDAAQCKNLIQQTVAIYGGIDILINNAATNPVFGPMAECDGKIFDKIMNVNVKACFLLANLCHPIMKKRSGGSIINISSVGGLKPGLGAALYSTSKAALIMLTQNQAKEWGKDNIRSNAICPGMIQTKFSASYWQDRTLLKKLEEQIPIGRMAQPEELAGLALFLASNASSYCTGGVYCADGGQKVIS